MEDAISASPWSQLNQDIADQIFTKLSLRSLLLSSAVCKHWRGLLLDPSLQTRIRTRKPWFFLYGQNNVFSKQNQAFGFDPFSSAWIRLPSSSADIFAGSSELVFSSASSSRFNYSHVLSSDLAQTSPLSCSRLNPLIGSYSTGSGSKKLIVVGGARFIGGLVDIEDHKRLAVEIYDFAADSWDLGPPLPDDFRSGNSSQWLCSCLLNNQFFFVFGIYSSKICAFDLKSNSWGPVRILRPDPNERMTASLRRKRDAELNKAKGKKIEEPRDEPMDDTSSSQAESDSDYEEETHEEDPIAHVDPPYISTTNVTESEDIVQDLSMLRDFKHHIAYSIWSKNYERKHLKCVAHIRKVKEWVLSNEVSEVVEKVKISGMFEMLEHSYKFIDYVAISAFAERWHPETNTFHLPIGEMSISLDDVYHILRVPVVGTCLFKEGGKDISLSDAKNLLVEDLGIEEKKAYEELEGKHSVRLDWLKTKFAGTSKMENATEEAYDRVTRAYLLYVLGCEAFADKSGTKISIHYLNALKEVDHINEEAWGMAILAYLYRQLGLASRKNVKQISGCLTLLMAWIYDHFPNLIKTGVPNEAYENTMPRMCKWTSTKQVDEPGYAIIRLREQLDDLTEQDVCWDPYSDLRSHYPLNDFAFYNGIIVCFDIAEPYYPDRILRQFGRVQYIPKTPMLPINTCSRGENVNQYKVFYDNGFWYSQRWQDHVLADDSRSTLVHTP